MITEDPSEQTVNFLDIQNLKIEDNYFNDSMA